LAFSTLRTDYLSLHQFSVIQRGDRSDDGRRLIRGAMSAENPHADQQSTHGLHYRGSLSLGTLVFGEETVEETGLFLLVVDIEVPAVVQCPRRELARLRVQRLLDGLVGVHAVLYDRHRPVPVKEVGVRSVDVTCLHAVNSSRFRASGQ